MTKIKNFFHKFWLFIFLASISAILIMLFFLNKNSRIEEKKILTSIINPKISYYNSIKPDIGSLESKFPDFPLQIEVFQVNSVNFSDREALKISQEFNYQEDPIIINDIYGPVYTWTNEFNNLSIYLKQGKFHYNLDLLRNPELISGLPPSIQESKIKFNELLEEKKLKPNEKFEIYFIDEGYFINNDSNFIKTNQDDPQKKFTFLKAIYKIDNLKVNGPEEPLISIYFGNNFQIARFDYNKIFKLTSLDNYPLKSKNDLLENIKQNPRLSYLKSEKGFYQENLINEDKIDLKSLSFEKIELIYYKETQTQSYLQPVFLITGKGVLIDGTQTEAGLYIPAIKDEYLLK